MKTLTVLIPIFNEERTIQELVHQLDAIGHGVISECIFVNDGSSDSTLTLLNNALIGVKYKYKVISKENGGKASAIQSGAKLLATTHVIILDSDLELETADIEVFWKVVTSDTSDFVFGYRKFLAHSSFTYRYSRGNQVLSNLYGVFFNEVITDIMCGYKLVPSKVIQDLPFRFKKFGLEIEIPMQMWKNRVRPFEVEVQYHARTRAQGKSISVWDAIAIIFSLIHFRLTNRRVQT
jgi:glycosyltransferase involved in cell wall biosynthesis